MSASDQVSPAIRPGLWVANQPYLLLSITAMCWAGMNRLAEAEPLYRRALKIDERQATYMNNLAQLPRGQVTF